MPERFAFYYAPATDDPLWLRAAEWLGRDPATGETYAAPVEGLERSYLAPLSASAQRYAFHATIKAPMALAGGRTLAQLEAAAAEFAATAAPVPIGPLKLANIDGYLALIPEQQGAPLTQFAAEVVQRFEPFRAPLSDADKAKRNGDGRLSPRQVELLERFGYPYVLEQFQFHMTLTDRLSDEDRAIIEPRAAAWFAEFIGVPRVVDRLALFHEPAPGAPFSRGRDFVLGKETT